MSNQINSPTIKILKIIFIFIFSFYNKLDSATNWNGTYTTGNYTIQDGDTIENAIFSGGDIYINISGNISGIGSDASLYIKPTNENDNIYINYIDNTSLNNLSFVFSGNGVSYNNIKQGSTVTLGSSDGVNKTYLCILSDDQNFATNTWFNIDSTTENNLNTLITINKNSAIYYGCSVNPSTINTPIANLYLNGSINNNSNSGSLGIIIKNQGSFLVEAITSDANPSFSNIDFSSIWENNLGFKTLSNCIFVNNISGNQISSFDGLQNSTSNSDITDLVSNCSSIIFQNENTIPIISRFPILTENLLGALILPRAGCIVGQGGQLCLDNGVSVIYTTRAQNFLPNPLTTPAGNTYAFTRLKNASALTFDGFYSAIGTNASDYPINFNTNDLLNKPTVFSPFCPKIIYLNDSTAGLFFASSCTQNSLITDPALLNTGLTTLSKDFLIPYYQQAVGNGCSAISFYNFGQSIIYGFNSSQSFISLLQNDFTASGGPLNPVATVGENDAVTIFPLYNFVKDSSGNFLQNGKSCLMIDDDLALSNVSFIVDDSVHQIVPNNSLNSSEPIITAGDQAAQLELMRTYYINPFGSLMPADDENQYWRRTKLYLNNNIFFLVSNGMATAGFDWNINNVQKLNISTTSQQDNTCFFDFMYQGITTPKLLVLGTPFDNSVNPGVLDPSSHFDIVSKKPALYPIDDSTLPLNSIFLTTIADSNYAFNGSFNISCNSNLIPTSIFLGANSNITLGKPYLDNLQTYPNSRLIISPNTSIISQGGPLQNIETTLETGFGLCNLLQGAFIDSFSASQFIQLSNNILGTTFIREMQNLDTDPKFKISNSTNINAQSSTMIYNKNTNNIYSICAPQENIQSYTIDCYNNYNNPNISYNSNFPNDPAFGNLDLTCLNDENIAMIEGSIGNLKISNSLSSALIKIRGGNLGAIYFSENSFPFISSKGLTILLEKDSSGVTPSVNISDCMLEGFSAPCSISSNGLRFVVKDSGIVNINKDLEILGSSQFFTIDNLSDVNSHTLELTSENGSALLLKANSILDFSHMGRDNKPTTVILSGNINLICEAGSMIAGGAENNDGNSYNINIILKDKAKITLKERAGLNDFIPSIDRIRVSGGLCIKHYDESSLEIVQKTSFHIVTNNNLNEYLNNTVIPTDSLVKVLAFENFNTSFSLNFFDNSTFTVNGIFQIGDICDEASTDRNIFCNLSTNDSCLVKFLPGSIFGIGSIVKSYSNLIVESQISQGYNLAQFGVKINGGSVDAGNIESSLNIGSSLFAIGYYPSNIFSFSTNLNQDNFGESGYLIGGSNIIALTEKFLSDHAFFVNPIIDSVSGLSQNEHYFAGILKPSKLAKFNNTAYGFAGGTSIDLFNKLSMEALNTNITYIPSAISLIRSQDGVFVAFVQKTSSGIGEINRIINQSFNLSNYVKAHGFATFSKKSKNLFI